MVICIGVPYANCNDPQVQSADTRVDLAVESLIVFFFHVRIIQVKLKMEFNDKRRARLRQENQDVENFLDGSSWYTCNAHRALNQAIGRCIRNSVDYGSEFCQFFLSSISLPLSLSLSLSPSLSLSQCLSVILLLHLNFDYKNIRSNVCSGAVVFLDERMASASAIAHLPQWIRQTGGPGCESESMEQITSGLTDFYARMRAHPAPAQITSPDTRHALLTSARAPAVASSSLLAPSVQSVALDQPDAQKAVQFCENSTSAFSFPHFD